MCVRVIYSVCVSEKNYFNMYMCFSLYIILVCALSGVALVDQHGCIVLYAAVICMNHEQLCKR